MTSEAGWMLMVLVGALIVLAIFLWSRRRGKSPRPVAKASPVVSTPTSVEQVQSSPKKTVFVSYRRDDSADVTGRIYDRLSSHFGTAEVFKDVDSIPLGRDFRDVIRGAVAKASVVVVVIGRHWLGSDQKTGSPRIHDANDFVRAEVSAALQQGKPVIPVFVSNGKMPMDSDLPEDIRDITYRNGVHVRPDPDFAHDVDRLIRGIERA
ncbi:MAG: TIR domain-containing protein [Sedimenticolaceae bacterium]|jgi:hypothetical protein